ncbi:cadherin repeat domain-containing protein [Granulicella arctica]|uniref:cadherin repeat domain-containing protein n=1 Tax=Granulicella arctica TaxID=940613 RepID=UPI0021E00FC6|nr:cadherin repeat domain-containing protein [Granulicella arctica]
MSLKVSQPYLLLAMLLVCAASALRAQTTPDCTAPPYNVPAGLPTAAITAAQDQAQMMCQQHLQFPTAASNPPLTALRETDPNKPVNAWPGTPASPETANWTDALGHTIVRWGWGAWTTYDDSQSGGVANVLCNGATPCVVANEKGSSTGGSMSGFGDYGPVGPRPYPAGDAPLGIGGTVPCTSPGCLAAGHYTRINLLEMTPEAARANGTAMGYAPNDLFTVKATGEKVKTPEDWWLKRRPEIFDLVQKEVYGYTWPAAEWPAITWSISGATTGTEMGVVSCQTSSTCPNGTMSNGVTYTYREKIYTGTISTASYPAVRNAPLITITCRLPANTPGKVPVFISIGETDTNFQYTAPLGFGACGYPQTMLQPDGGGGVTSSYLIGLINKGNWRKPTDPGALVAWAWGISRMIDEFTQDTDPMGPDPDKVAVEGHSRDGKATLVTAAYDDRVVASLPSCGGEGGTSFMRRAFGESVESIAGSGEYYWMAGNLMNYAGPKCQKNPDVGPAGCTPAFFPRKVEDLDVDAHAVMALIAPRAVMTNGGTDTPYPGYGDAWQDPRGMYLSGKLASPVWELLGWKGQVIPKGTVFTSNPTPYGSGESIGGTPPFDTAFIDGTVGYRRHVQGHTDQPDWPVFVTFASKYLNDVRPVITPGQKFILPLFWEDHVGTVRGTAGGGGGLRDWQIKGGSGATFFTVDRQTGAITIPDRGKLKPFVDSYSLTLMVSDGILPSHDETVTIKVPFGLGFLSTQR